MGTQDEGRQIKTTTQYVLDTTMRKLPTLGSYIKIYFNFSCTISIVCILEMNTISEARRKQDLNRMRRTDLYTLKDLTL